jgi:hypothetical protein
MRILSLLVLAAIAAPGCGSPDSSTCPTPLAPTHLLEGYCDGNPGFCFHETMTFF